MDGNSNAAQALTSCSARARLGIRRDPIYLPFLARGSIGDLDACAYAAGAAGHYEDHQFTLKPDVLDWAPPGLVTRML